MTERERERERERLWDGYENIKKTTPDRET